MNDSILLLAGQSAVIGILLLFGALGAQAGICQYGSSKYSLFLRKCLFWAGIALITPAPILALIDLVS